MTKAAARPASASPPMPSSDELDAALRVIEKRAPGLRRAGVLRATIGAVDVTLDAPPGEPVRKRPGDRDDEDAPLFDTKAFAGRGRRRRDDGDDR